MSQSVSVPEKTLEHWSSQYVTYRYRSWAAQWWPASGEDIDLACLPARPGKAVQLELKTTTITSGGLHRVQVDLGQLWEYRQRPLGHQPFYAFPWPSWRGTLTEAANSDGRPVTELGFGRSGPGWWFRDWMILLTAADVATVLGPELAAHGCRERGTRKQLVQFGPGHSAAAWGSGTAPPPAVIRWREFWPTLERCGRAGWPQLIQLPAGSFFARDRPRLSWLDVSGLLQEAAGMMDAAEYQDDGGRLVTLEPDESGSYGISEDRAGDPGSKGARVGDDRADEVGDNRQIVYLDARALAQSGI